MDWAVPLKMSMLHLTLEMLIWTKVHGHSRENSVIVQPMPYFPNFDDLKRHKTNKILQCGEQRNATRQNIWNRNNKKYFDANYAQNVLCCVMLLCCTFYSPEDQIPQWNNFQKKIDFHKVLEVGCRNHLESLNSVDRLTHTGRYLASSGLDRTFLNPSLLQGYHGYENVELSSLKSEAKILV